MSEKNIIVTGGTDGIGLALTKRLLQDEHRVFIIGKNEIKGNNVIKELNSNKVEFIQCDLSEKKELINLSKKLIKLNKIDCLVNNAGAIFEKRETNSLDIEKTFAIYSVKGQKIISGNSNTKINVSQLAKGMYFLKIEGQKSKVIIKK